MPIDWTSVNWGNVGILSGLVFLAAVIANFLSSQHRVFAAVITAVLFAVAYVFWTAYPHGLALPTLK